MTNWQKELEKLDPLVVAPFELNDELIKELKSTCSKAKKDSNKFNNNLAGHIGEEYQITDLPEKFTNFLSQIIKHEVFEVYLKRLDLLSHAVPFYLDKLWVNYQKKYEFNPIHTHSGAFSFVVFLKIPYSLKKEDKYYSKNGTKQDDLATSRFTFLNPCLNYGVRATQIDVDKSFEGKGFMFPSKQSHMVYPFYTSNEYRITVSGNIRLKVK